MGKKLIFITLAITRPVVGAAESNSGGDELILTLDDLWVLMAAALVFFMQAGFKVLESGLVKKEHKTGIGAKNLLDWVAGSIAFFLVGYEVMFGDSFHGLIGMGFFSESGLTVDSNFIFFLFQLAFAGTALTIVSGAMSGRTALMPYFIASLVTATIIYPVFGHWVWGNLINEDNKPWLADLGFIDFAGSTVVHSVGAWIGLVGIWIVGPRIGRYNGAGKIQPVKASDYSYSILGVMILWLGWWGFNGGSVLAFNTDVAKIILNTNLAGAGACFTAFFHCYLFQGKRDVIEKIAGGSLTGLVAITACCHVVSPHMSLLIGAIAGVIHNLALVLLTEKWKLDDPVGAIPVHGFGGIFGTLCVALFGEAELLAHPRWIQLAVQLIGIVTCFGFTTVIAYAMFKTLKWSVGLRVSPAHELSGAIFSDEENETPVELLSGQILSQVSIKVSERGYNLMPIDEYLEMSAKERVKLIDENKVQYLDSTGNVITAVKAVRQMVLMLEGQRDEVLEEKSRVDEEKKNITQSINYASQIQGAILGQEDDIKELFPDSFVFFRPREVVSGDFYWFAKVKGYKIVVSSDCTGHGVPGAFLTVLGVSLLNEIVMQKKIVPPEKVLEMLDYKLIYALHSKNQQFKSSDGMDIGVMVIDENRSKLYFSGARSNLFHFSNGELHEVKGDRFSLGYLDKSIQKVFTRQTLDYKKEDVFYLSSDGFMDQHNPLGKKYMRSKFKKHLSDIGYLDMANQYELMKKEFDEWKLQEEQTDDVLVLGVKL